MVGRINKIRQRHAFLELVLFYYASYCAQRSEERERSTLDKGEGISLPITTCAPFCPPFGRNFLASLFAERAGS